MTTTDWIGFIGVGILLVAYFLNLSNKIQKDGKVYLLLNLVGGSIACAASFLLHYLPFIILEGSWAFISAYALYKFYSKQSL